MSKPKSERLDIVRKLAQQKEQQAAQGLLGHRQRLEIESQQLEQLQSYHTDYLLRIEQQKQTSVADVITYRDFSHRLASAVQQQSKKVEVVQAELDMANKQWILLREKRLAVEEVIAHSRAEEQSESDRLEQKSLDEMAGNKGLRFVEGR